MIIYLNCSIVAAPRKPGLYNSLFKESYDVKSGKTPHGPSYPTPRRAVLPHIGAVETPLVHGLLHFSVIIYNLIAFEKNSGGRHIGPWAVLPDFPLYKFNKH